MGKTETKRKPLSIEKPMNSPVIHEVSTVAQAGGADAPQVHPQDE